MWTEEVLRVQKDGGFRVNIVHKIKRGWTKRRDDLCVCVCVCVIRGQQLDSKESFLIQWLRDRQSCTVQNVEQQIRK